MVRLRNRGCMGSLVALGTVIFTFLAVIGAGEALLGAMDEERYKLGCHTVFTSVVKSAMESIDKLRSRVNGGELCVGLGSQADGICNRALERFCSEAPDTRDERVLEEVFDERIEELERTLDPPLEAVYLRQLSLISDLALQRYKTLARNSETSDYQAMVSADQYFATEAEVSTRQGSNWDYAVERSGLQTIMNEIAKGNKKATDAQLKAAQQQNTAMQYLQVQQQQLQQLQKQMYGSRTPFNLGVAYRIPDTNINLAANCQQGRTILRVTCVPDDFAPLLGPNGFQNGVGPGNVGINLSFRL